MRVLAALAGSDGEILQRVPNPRPLEAALKQLRHLCRERSRRIRGSARYTQTSSKISRLHRRVASIRGHHLHVLTSRLAKTHGEVVVEGLDAAGMLRQKGLAGARARRRGLSDSALAEARRQLAYKTGWYGSRLITADRWYPSSKTCHACGHVQDIGWHEYWTCNGCGAGHQRDDNAAINLARYEPPCAGDSAVAVMTSPRIVVTGAKDGKSVVVSDGEATTFGIPLMPGSDYTPVWAADETPVVPDSAQATQPRTYFPPAGDVLVQHGTRHAWRNKSDQPCVLVVAVTGARRA